MKLCGIDRETAIRTIKAAGKSIPIAVVMLKANVDKMEAMIELNITALTRLTYAFSKSGKTSMPRSRCTSPTTTSAESKAIRVTPAMEAGIADHVWSMAELLH